MLYYSIHLSLDIAISLLAEVRIATDWPLFTCEAAVIFRLQNTTLTVGLHGSIQL